MQASASLLEAIWSVDLLSRSGPEYPTRQGPRCRELTVLPLTRHSLSASATPTQNRSGPSIGGLSSRATKSSHVPRTFDCKTGWCPGLLEKGRQIALLLLPVVPWGWSTRDALPNVLLGASISSTHLGTLFLTERGHCKDPPTAPSFPHRTSICQETFSPKKGTL